MQAGSDLSGGLGAKGLPDWVFRDFPWAILFAQERDSFLGRTDVFEFSIEENHDVLTRRRTRENRCECSRSCFPGFYRPKRSASRIDFSNPSCLGMPGSEQPRRTFPTLSKLTAVYKSEPYRRSILCWLCRNVLCGADNRKGKRKWNRDYRKSSSQTLLL